MTCTIVMFVFLTILIAGDLEVLDFTFDLLLVPFKLVWFQMLIVM